jgi:hypothetical protein
MSIDTNRLVQIAAALKELELSKEKLLAELQRIAGGESAAPRRGRPPLSWVPAPTAAVAPRRRGRPPGSKNRAKPAVAPAPGRKPRKGLTTDIVGLLAGGGAFTAGDIVGKLKLPATKSKISSVSTTLVRLVKDGRVKKDSKRGYRAA